MSSLDSVRANLKMIRLTISTVMVMSVRAAFISTCELRPCVPDHQTSDKDQNIFDYLFQFEILWYLSHDSVFDRVDIHSHCQSPFQFSSQVVVSEYLQTSLLITP